MLKTSSTVKLRGVKSYIQARRGRRNLGSERLTWLSSFPMSLVIWFSLTVVAQVLFVGNLLMMFKAASKMNLQSFPICSLLSFPEGLWHLWERRVKQVCRTWKGYAQNVFHPPSFCLCLTLLYLLIALFCFLLATLFSFFLNCEYRFVSTCLDLSWLVSKASMTKAQRWTRWTHTQALIAGQPQTWSRPYLI